MCPCLSSSSGAAVSGGECPGNFRALPSSTPKTPWPVDWEEGDEKEGKGGGGRARRKGRGQRQALTLCPGSPTPGRDKEGPH